MFQPIKIANELCDSVIGKFGHLRAGMFQLNGCLKLKRMVVTNMKSHQWLHIHLTPSPRRNGVLYCVGHLFLCGTRTGVISSACVACERLRVAVAVGWFEDDEGAELTLAALDPRKART